MEELCVSYTSTYLWTWEVHTLEERSEDNWKEEEEVFDSIDG